MESENVLFVPKLEYSAGAELPGNGRFYARFSQAEAMTDENDEPETFALFFEAFEADWFDRYQGSLEPDSRPQLYREARLALLEIRTPREGMGEFMTYVETADQPQTSWVEIYSHKGGGGTPLYVYANLFQEPVNRAFDKIGRVDDDRARRLEQTVNLDHLPDATDEELDAALLPVGKSPIPYAIAYDVGQGNAAGLYGTDDFVKAYLDIGGGAGAHVFSFPAALKSFCFTRHPVIILSHWDHDHWSSAWRAPAAFNQTWIAPRQSIGAIQAAVVARVLSTGRLLLISSPFPPRHYGRLMLERCTGTGRNNSGLAVTLSQKEKGKGLQMLFPADAQYRYVGSCAPGKSFLSMVAPHHGATPKSSVVPASIGRPASRLVYSYGRGNSYGHATKPARGAHHAAGWQDPKVPPKVPGGDVRNTEDRGAAGLGHILLAWAVASTPPPMCCGGVSCQLGAVQL